ncbi:NAD-dependent epimerase/dehydratase family protein [uncultured Vagococcus sp.]|uniref:NAD-dependent epimerase/dehydratase family protein n=1 Tax=uncultured Vagococcus sp. TaxID=189676 RepID=UPI0028D3B784|nr:NAD-dependent epimerase/dehydratase family protein [uncultured Vagococcus sp.]
MKNTLYLVTGAAGFLGNNIVHQLITRGKSVRALVLPGDKAAQYLPEKTEVCYGDLTELSRLEHFFSVPEGVELVVIHCASLVTTSPNEDPLVYNVNVTGTKHIVALSVKHNVKKLVYVSSTGAILELPHGQIIEEPLSFYPEKVIGYYAKTKALATQHVLNSVNETGLDATIIYPSGISGPYDGSFGPFVSFIIRYCKGDMPVGVEGTFNAVDVRDLATATIEAVTKGRKGEGYILSNELVEMRQMFDLISLSSGAPIVETILPPQQMLEMAGANLASKSTTNDKRDSIKFELYNLSRNNNFSNQKAKQELGFELRPFDETIRDTITWLKNEKKI